MPPIEGELTAPDDSLRSELEAAFTTDTGGGDAADGQANPSEAAGSAETVPGAAAPVTPSAAPAADGRQRGPDGKFIEKTAAPEKVAAATDSPSTDAAKASEVAAQPAASAPPAGWTAAEKAEWSKLSPVAQAAVSRREAEIANGGKQWSEEKRRYESVLSPVAEAARRNGLTTEDGLKSLLQAQSFLERDPTAAIKWLAQSHGVNLATLAGQPPAEVPSAQPPDIQAMVRQIVNQTVSPIVGPIQQRWNDEAARQQEMTVQAIHSFASAPGHEHYNAVEGTIALILPQVIEENPGWTNEQKLQEAYDRALYATPSTRQQMLAAKESAAEETRRQEAAARATKARGAAVSVTGSPQGSAAPESAGTLREEILRAMTG
jgi:hypothetical protein